MLRAVEKKLKLKTIETYKPLKLLFGEHLFVRKLPTITCIVRKLPTITCKNSTGIKKIYMHFRTNQLRLPNLLKFKGLQEDNKKFQNATGINTFSLCS